ncbi:penicillin-binding protein [Actinopolymorpha pittospori]|uniref:Membrane peptidoglycan carboxypeptidase n=1 Tax=Actinopolymorpha pittospori TaxID=648752 RepID=A0A927MX40_9ACTN|nr:penicillin-binding protein [Actinopolymorpha pittospori]MBE1606358.1 membrane peptidoglycan carboxypeptidase [Actinopolymorpha pittospori]
MSRTRGERGFVSQLLLFVVISALTGALAAGLVVPFAGLLGLSTQSTTDAFENMDANLQDPPLPERSRLLAADGSLIATFYDQNRVEVPLKQVAKVMQNALLAIEDARFYQHGPLDAQGTLRAFVRNSQSGGVSQGGSSLTQQYVKQVLFETAATEAEQQKVVEDSYGRKLQELRYAVELEKTMTKDEILEKYFNIVYFGDGAYGVESAAKHYFSTSASKLTLTQAATLASIVRDPNNVNPAVDPQATLSRRNLVLSRMADVGMISQPTYEEARKAGLGLRMNKTPRGCYYSPYPFFCDYAEQVLLDDPALGKTRDERRRVIDQGGLTIRTTLDPQAQRAADKAVSENVHPTDGAIGALSMVEPGTGYIKAMAQSRGYGRGKGKTFINLNAQHKYNGSIGYQPGSTFKPFVLAAAIRQGIPLTAEFPSPGSTVITGPVRTCENGKPGYNRLPWKVSNSTSAGSTSTLISGTTHSVNTFFGNLEKQTGICEPANIATRLGATRSDGDPLQQVKPFTLGVNEIAPVSMAEAYASFAARGLHCKAIPITEVTDRTGNQVKVQGPQCKQEIPKEVADGVNYTLRQVIDGPDPGRTGADMHLDGRQAAGKTGTSEDRIGVWFMGYTTNLATAAVITDADPPQKSLLGTRIAGRTVGGDQVWGGKLAGPMWTAAMKGALEGRKSANFVEPNPDLVQGIPTNVPSVISMGRSKAERTLKAAGFTMAMGSYVDSGLPRGTVARQSPGPNSTAGSGTTVTIYLSDGTPPAPPPQPPLPPDLPRVPDLPKPPGGPDGPRGPNLPRGPGGPNGPGIPGLLGASGFLGGTG